MKSFNLCFRILGCSLLLLFTHMSYATVPETSRFTGLKWVDLPDSSGHKGMFIAVTESATVYTSYDGVIWTPKILPGFPTQATRITGVAINDDEVTFITEERETEDSIYVRNISYTKDLRNLVNQGTPYIQRPTVKTNNHRIPGKELVIGNRVLRLYTHSIEVAITQDGKSISKTLLYDSTNDFIDLDSAPLYDDKGVLTGYTIVASGYLKRYIFQLDLANEVKNKVVVTIDKAAESDIIVGGKELFKIHMNPSTLTLAAIGDNGRFTETPVVTSVSPGAQVAFAASLGNLNDDGSVDIIVMDSHTTTDIITGNFTPTGRFVKHSAAPIDKRTCATVGKDAQGNYIFLILGEGNKSLYSRDGLNWIIKQM